MNLNNIATEVIAIVQKLPQSQAEEIGKLIQVLGSVGPILNSPTIASQKCDAEKLLLEIIQTNADLRTFEKDPSETSNKRHKKNESTDQKNLEQLSDLSIPELLAVCNTNKNLKEKCENQDFWKKFFRANKSKKRSSGISTNEYHYIVLKKKQSEVMGDNNALTTIKNIERELMTVDKDINYGGKGIVYNLIVELQYDLVTGQRVMSAIERGLFVKEPILLELLRNDQWDHGVGKCCKIIRHIYKEFCKAVIANDDIRIKKILPILDTYKDEDCFPNAQKDNLRRVRTEYGK
jgi:hypothetical protein